MKKIIILLITLHFSAAASSQNFNAAITTAKSAYAANKLEEAHFALLQAMQEIDLIIGKEVLKIVPLKMNDLAVNTKDDNVSVNTGYIGTTIRRTFGTTRKAELTIMSNSPMVASINMVLNNPIFGGMSSDGNTKLIRLKGYKGQLLKETNSTTGLINYTINIPLGNSLFTFKVDNTTDTEITAMAETIPLEEIAKLIQ